MTNLEGWQSLNWLRGRRLVRALREQMAPEHPLNGIRLKAIMQSDHSDDVLYEMRDGRVALVHLTWQQETRPNWPSTSFFSSLRVFEAEIAKP